MVEHKNIFNSEKFKQLSTMLADIAKMNETKYDLEQDVFAAQATVRRIEEDIEVAVENMMRLVDEIRKEERDSGRA